MTVEEARAIYGYSHPGSLSDGYVNCTRCPIDDDNCSLIHGEIIGKSATGYRECWEHIAKFMTEREGKSTKRESKSAIDHPSHYAGAKFECIEVMREVFGDDAVKTFCLLNAFKYIWRCGKKHDTPYADIAKALWYLEKHKNLEEGAGENGKQDDAVAEGA